MRGRSGIVENAVMFVHTTNTFFSPSGNMRACVYEANRAVGSSINSAPTAVAWSQGQDQYWGIKIKWNPHGNGGRNSERKWPSPYGTSTDNLTRRNCIASFLQVDETETSDGIEVIVVFVPEYPNDGYLAGGFGIGSPPAWLTSGAHGGPFYEWYEGPSTNVASDLSLIHI